MSARVRRLERKGGRADAEVAGPLLSREKMMRGADTRVSGRMVLVRREGDIWG